eukprot:scaffold159019_cov32-Prasinocladus_malaysianus.AAC.2
MFIESVIEWIDAMTWLAGWVGAMQTGGASQLQSRKQASQHPCILPASAALLSMMPLISIEIRYYSLDNVKKTHRYDS